MTPPPPTEPLVVFEQYRSDVYAWAYRLLGRHHDALDAAQDVFLRWLAQSKRAQPDHPRSWFRQVTINRAIDLLRARRIAPAAQNAAADRPAPIEPDALEQLELRRDIGAALERLTDAQRSVLVAKIYDGLTFAQIAAEMDLAVPTIKTHYLRALAAVRDRLSSRWADERKKQ